jgi:hypothetical protein
MSKDVTIDTNTAIDTKIVTKKARVTVTLATDNNLTPKLLFYCTMPYTKSVTI